MGIKGLSQAGSGRGGIALEKRRAGHQGRIYPKGFKVSMDKFRLRSRRKFLTSTKIKSSSRQEKKGKRMGLFEVQQFMETIPGCDPGGIH